MNLHESFRKNLKITLSQLKNAYDLILFAFFQQFVPFYDIDQEDDIEYFMTSDADAIITDSVKLSGEIKEKLTERAPLDIILQKMFSTIQ